MHHIILYYRLELLLLPQLLPSEEVLVPTVFALKELKKSNKKPKKIHKIPLFNCIRRECHTRKFLLEKWCGNQVWMNFYLLWHSILGVRPRVFSLEKQKQEEPKVQIPHSHWVLLRKQMREIQWSVNIPKNL